MHDLTMKIKGLPIISIGLSLLLFAPTVAYADQSPSPSPEIQMLLKKYKGIMDQYQKTSSMKKFEELQKMREKIRMQINRTFMNSVNKANKEAHTALKTAKGASAKTEIITKQKYAINEASDLRDSELLALGLVPTPPATAKKGQGESGKERSKREK